MFLDLLRSTHGEKLLRVKGIVQIAEDPDRPLSFMACRRFSIRLHASRIGRRISGKRFW